MDDFWITRIQDNRIQGILRELAEAIEECEDAETLHRLKSSLGLGLANLAAQRAREEREREARGASGQPPTN